MRYLLALIVFFTLPLCAKQSEEMKQEWVQYKKDMKVYNSLKDKMQNMLSDAQYARRDIANLFLIVSLSHDVNADSEKFNNKIGYIDNEIDKLTLEKKGLFGNNKASSPFQACSQMVADVDSLWTHEKNFLGKLLANKFIMEDYAQIEGNNNSFSGSVVNCQTSIDLPPEKPDPNYIVVDKNTPVY